MDSFLVLFVVNQETIGRGSRLPVPGFSCTIVNTTFFILTLDIEERIRK